MGMMKRGRVIGRSHGEAGLTLIEIIIVLIVLAVVFSLLTGKVFTAGERVRRDANLIKMNQLKSAIQEYQLRYNSIPPTLDALIKGPDGATGSFTPMTDEASLRDVWDTPFIYSREGNARRYSIKTLGADGLEGGTGVDFDDVITGP